MSPARSYLPSVWHARICSHAISQFSCHHIHHHHHNLPQLTRYLLTEQASVLLSSPNVSTVDGGVHGHRAFVFFSPYIVDRGALPRLTLKDAIYVRCMCSLSACVCACIKIYVHMCARRKSFFGLFLKNY